MLSYYFVEEFTLLHLAHTNAYQAIGSLALKYTRDVSRFGSTNLLLFCIGLVGENILA